jgi:hypothetical protein
MKKLAKREQWLAFIGGVGLVIFVTVWILQGALADMKDAAVAEKKVADKLRITKKLLAKRDDVATQLEVLQRRLPRYGPDQDVTAEQMRTLDRIAQEQSFGLGQREPQAEGTNGAVREIVIHSAWDSTLDALTHMLYALQTQDVIFDVRRLTVIPVQGNADHLKGQLVINSAYAVTDVPTGTNAVAVAGTNGAASASANTNASAGSATNAEAPPPAAFTNGSPGTGATTNAEAAPAVSTNANLSIVANPPAAAAVITTNKPGTP